MLHIFVDPSEIGDILVVRDADANHIGNVLRMKPGDEISVSDGTNPRDYRYRIEEFRGSEVVCRLAEVIESEGGAPGGGDSLSGTSQGR